MRIRGPRQRVCLPRGFRFSCGLAGIKASGRPDLALAEAPQGAAAAAVFTRNRAAAAPVLVGRARLVLSRGRLRAVLVNSGNANAGNGPAGVRAAETCCAALARQLGVAPGSVLPSSTGIIGVPFPAQKVVAAVPGLAEGLRSGEPALRAFGRAIMTTDLRPKLASASFSRNGRRVCVAGVVKGAGMIQPDMATMLAYIFTDVAAAPSALRRLLKPAVDASFNAISVDSDTSTNDTVLLLASGASGADLAGVQGPFSEALRGVCRSLAEQVVRDGEGARHLVRLQVRGAASAAEASTAARSVANSPLVKTAWAGCDPNWGRILAALGKAAFPFDPARASIAIGPHRVFAKGRALAFDRKAAHRLMQRPEYSIRVDLGRGRAELEFLTCDLTHEYIRINAEYST
ncbi:MAG: bifunctional glutamate N-acetyltransferase/amino-acid acetyltransferase ArgJ [Elusimicrobia bacterium]|nr:bifunctional glutamate N-acetyltransferase/amino-acid acetyltransferase ArgJ [Elusimicrobiota bacterium]